MSTLKDSIAMKCTETQPCQQKVEFTISKETIAAEKKSVLKDFANYVNIPGFRKGKAPAKMIESRYKDEITDELKRRFFSNAFDKVAKDDKFEIVSYGMPNDEEMPVIDTDKDFVFTMLFDTAPEFDIPEYKGLKLEAEVSEITDEEISEKVEQYKEMYAEFKAVEEPAAKGDMLKASYSADAGIEEELSPNAQRLLNQEEGWLWLSEPEMIPGLIAALEGAETGKDYTFTAEFPADFREAELAGKKAEYKVTVIEVQKRVPVASEEELCQKMQVESLDKLRESITESMKNEREMMNEQALRESAFEQIIEKVADFPLPPEVLNSEAQKELRNMANTTVKSEEDAEAFKNDIDKHKETAEEAAKAKLVKAFIAKKIASSEEITISENELDTQIELISRYHGMKVTELRKTMEENGSIEDVQIEMLIAKVADFIIENADVKK